MLSFVVVVEVAAVVVVAVVIVDGGDCGGDVVVCSVQPNSLSLNLFLHPLLPLSST